ncbi:hypothetical protein JD844_013527 [Phrynosoma platyrhinos]|uniref:Uncharacterized protein n=1 Tax=Phrynosoma platyrhinos TaxID=52577 RepID=A0ABQ7TKY2_PHRPL|nr:hypothetical protein JD844_013527 [Phrynosoma platyrhinos]
MAAENSRKRLRQEATCSICLSYFTRPVMLECGHSFCEICILRCWQEPDTPTQCPECRGPTEKHFKPIRCLVNLVEILNKWDRESEAHTQASECQQHQRPLSLFCKEDQALLCGGCEGSQEHLGHNIAPMEEAAQEYKERTNIQRRKIAAHFYQLQKYLEEQEKLLLTQIDEVETEITRRRDEHMVRISNELFSLERLIQEMEEKCQQPASEFLQDIQRTLVKYKERETFETPEVFTPELKLKTWEFVDLNYSIQAVMKLFRDNLEDGLALQKADPLWFSLSSTVKLTFEVGAANPILTVSEDHKSVRRIAKSQDLPANRQRFDSSSTVLGHPALTSGRHFWDVILENAEHWGVGVVRESAVRDLSKFIMRRGCFKDNSKKGIWALKSPTRSCLSRSSPLLLCVKNLKRIRVILNYPGQRLAFINMDNGHTIWACAHVSFAGEPIIPFFWLGAGACLTLL